MSLKGKLIVLTRSVAGNRAWRRHFERLGASVYSFPTIEVQAAEPTTELIDVLNRINEFDWIIFTSAMGPHFFRSIAARLDIDVSPERMPPIAVIGERTAGAVRKLGYRVAFQPRVASSKNLARELYAASNDGTLADTKPIKGSALLLLRSAIAQPELPEKLAALGGRVTDLAVYKTVPVQEPDPEFEKLLEQGKIDFLTFASPSAVRGFLGRVPKRLHKIAFELPTVALGVSIARALATSEFKNILTVKKSSVKEMINVILTIGF